MDGTILGKKYDIINGGGGGGGTSDYEQLSNLPKINSVELKGNKSLADLGIASAGDVEGLDIIVGDENSGLVKDVNDLKTTVGDSSSGLVKDVGDLATTVGGFAGAIAALQQGAVIKPIYTSNIQHTDQGITVNFSHTFTEAGFLFVNFTGRFMDQLTLEFNNNQLFLMETDYYKVANRILPVAANDTFEIAVTTTGSDDSLVADVYFIKGYTPVSGNTRKKKG